MGLAAEHNPPQNPCNTKPLWGPRPSPDTQRGLQEKKRGKPKVPLEKMNVQEGFEGVVEDSRASAQPLAQTPSILQTPHPSPCRRCFHVATSIPTDTWQCHANTSQTQQALVDRTRRGQSPRNSNTAGSVSTPVDHCSWATTRVPRAGSAPRPSRQGGSLLRVHRESTSQWLKLQNSRLGTRQTEITSLGRKRTEEQLTEGPHEATVGIRAATDCRWTRGSSGNFSSTVKRKRWCPGCSP